MSYDALSRPLTRTEPEGSGSLIHTYTWGTSATARNIGQLEWMQTQGVNVSGFPSWRESYTYDLLGRRARVRHTENGTTHYDVNLTYDANTGLLDTLTYPTSTAGYRFALKYGYQNGQLSSIADAAAPANVYWRASASDPRGNITDELLGNGIRTLRGYDAVTGRIDFIRSGQGSTHNIQNLSYLFDSAGNLIQRQDSRQGLTESFYYDNLYRLDYSTLNGVPNFDLSYNAQGNITEKLGLAYQYHPQKIHAVTNVSGFPSSEYDANGNNTGIPNLATISWYASNLLKSGTYLPDGSSSTFYYGPDEQRFMQVATYEGDTESTTYIGDLVEKVISGSTQTWRHYVYGPSDRVGVYIRRSDGTQAMYFFTHDHLGSIDSITNATGNVEVRLSYGAHGERRNEAGWSGSVPDADWLKILSITRRGFTGHEMLDHLDVIHMNGRVLDTTSGRFLSADPYTPDPLNTQSYNRYSYVSNNPLTFIDPSGFVGLPPPEGPPPYIPCDFAPYCPSPPPNPGIPTFPDPSPGPAPNPGEPGWVPTPGGPRVEITTVIPQQVYAETSDSRESMPKPQQHESEQVSHDGMVKASFPPPPPGIPGGPWSWFPDPSNSRGGTWRDPLGRSASWDRPGNHWDVDNGKGGKRERFDRWGNLLKDGHRYRGPRLSPLIFPRAFPFLWINVCSLNPYLRVCGSPEPPEA
jgi:RHS repeat-associated protein